MMEKNISIITYLLGILGCIILSLYAEWYDILMLSIILNIFLMSLINEINNL